MSRRSIAVALTVLGMLAVAAPAEAVVEASGELRRESTTRYQLIVRNTGDEPISQILYDPSLFRGRLISQSTPGGICDPYTRGNGSFICYGFTLEPGLTRIFSFSMTEPYPRGARLRLTGWGVNPDITDPGHTSLVTAPPAAGQPVVGRSELVEPVRGVVLVRRRGSRRFVPLRAGRRLPDGSEIDTRRGTARITVASDQRGGRSTATVSEGRVIIDQNRARRPTTTLKLSEPLACPRSGTTTAAAARARKQRQIFVKTNGGRFKTRGNHAAGTATGTAWRTTDTCTTTTINVTEGTVRVRDLARRRTLNVTAPNSYTARRR